MSLNHPLCTQLLRGLRPRDLLPVPRKLCLLDFKMRQCFRYVRPTIFKVQLGHIGSRRIEVNEELQQTKGYRGASVDNWCTRKVPARARDSGPFAGECSISPVLAVDAIHAHSINSSHPTQCGRG